MSSEYTRSVILAPVGHGKTNQIPINITVDPECTPG